jgi:hypothetical protein
MNTIARRPANRPPRTATRRTDRTAAERMRRKRRRAAEGTRELKVEVNVDKSVEALKQWIGLTEVEAQALDWPEIEKELRIAFDDWILTWSEYPSRRNAQPH